RTLFTEFLLPFEIAALILTVGLIAAVPLTLRRRSGLKTQKPAQQVRVQREDRIRLVKMDAEKRQESTP
ncbi:MAG: NADH-quinone oxidoreductase subunit J, partial [Dokdonella sp.]